MCNIGKILITVSLLTPLHRKKKKTLKPVLGQKVSTVTIIYNNVRNIKKNCLMNDIKTSS